MRKLIQKIGFTYLFLGGVCLLYLVLALFNSQAALAGFKAFLKLFTRILPTLGLVYTLLFLSNLLIDTNTVTRYLGRKSNKGGWLIAIVGGIISAGPIYLWYPLLSDFKEKGMRDALIAVFLYNRAVKIPLLPVMIQYFGVKLVLVLTIYMILLSILNGLIVEKFTALKRRKV